MNNLLKKYLYFLELTIFIILGNEKMFKEIEKIFRKKEAMEEKLKEEFNKKDIEKFNTCFECKYFQTKSAPYCKYWKAYLYYFEACEYFNK
jgi:hypothetical protein